MQVRDQRDGQGGVRAVSHVIGVVLLLAVTVLLVAAAAVYVTGFGDHVREPAPTFSSSTSFDDGWEPHGQYLNVTHESGDTLETANLRLDVNDAAWYDPATDSTGSVALKSGVIEAQVGAEWTASETLSIERRNFTDGTMSLEDAGTHVDLGDATVRIVYEPPDSDRSEPVYTCHVAFPDCESAPS